MIALDTNILVYAHRSESSLHGPALARLRELVEGNLPWALPVFCIGEFVRVVTNARIFRPPTGIESALDFLSQLLGSPSARLLLPGTTFPALFADACRDAAVQGNLAFDGQIAAVCREHGVTSILTEDRDFARFASPTPVRLTAR